MGSAVAEHGARDRERFTKLMDPAIYSKYPNSKERQEARQKRARELIPLARLAAAKNAGFRVAEIYYHVTQKPWASGVPSRDTPNWDRTEWGDGLYMTSSVGMALRYGLDNFDGGKPVPDGSVIMPFVLRKDAKIFHFGDDGFARDNRHRLADPAGVTAKLQRKGLDGAFNPNKTQLVVWNTDKVRHIDADFDPGDRTSRDIFA